MAEEKKGFWKRFVSWLSGLKNIFMLRRKKDVMQKDIKTSPKTPVVQGTPPISPETKMELNIAPEDQKLEGILDQAAKVAKKQKEPEPPKELLSDQEAKNAARMLPILMALSMATAGPEEKKVKKPGSKKWKGSKVGFAAKEKRRIHYAGKRRSV